MKMGYKNGFFFLYFWYLLRRLKNCKIYHVLHWYASLVKLLLKFELIKAHLKSFRPILSSYETILNIFIVFWVRLGSRRSILAYLGSFRLIWAHLDSLELIKAHLSSFRLVQAYVGSFERFSEAVTRGVLQKKVFFEISQNSHGNTCARVSF